MEAREENSQMHVLTKRGTQDAAAVKVLSIMALIFLPATVVSVSPPSSEGWNALD